MFVAISSNHETWLICGGQDFTDETVFDSAMGYLIGAWGHPDRVIHGAAKGADALADDWARRMALDVVACPADWKAHGKAAGPIRNREMLGHKPHRVIAFPGGRGTADMIKQARAAGIEVAEIKINPEAAYRFPHLASQADLDREALIRRATRVAEFITLAVLFVALAVFGPAACEMAVM